MGKLRHTEIKNLPKVTHILSGKQEVNSALFITRWPLAASTNCQGFHKTHALLMGSLLYLADFHSINDTHRVPGSLSASLPEQ